MSASPIDLPHAQSASDQSAPYTSFGDHSKPTGEKLQKVLANEGLGSRRQLEEVIKAGRVSINGKVAHLGERAQMSDEIRIDGRLIRTKSKRDKRIRVIAYYKPEGEICSMNDPEGRPTVFDRLPKLTHDRWVMVGRLDINSSGLLLFTNDGELAHRLMHPSSEVGREYAVRVLGELDATKVRALSTGVMLDDGLAKFDDIKEGGGTGVNRWYHVTLKEGRKREVRRMFESQALTVSRLIRTRYGTYRLPSELKTGRFIELSKGEIGALGALVGLRTRNAGATDTVKQKQARIHKKRLNSAKTPRGRAKEDRGSGHKNHKHNKDTQAQSSTAPSRRRFDKMKFDKV